MKAISTIAALSCALLIAGCGPQENPAVTGDCLTFGQTSLKVQTDQFRQVEVFAVKAGEQTLVDNSLLEWNSSDPEVVSVTGGVLRAKQTGTSVITASYGKLSASLKVTVRDGVTSTGIDAHFSADNIYDLGHKTAANSGIQSFGFDSAGDIYYIQNGAAGKWYENHLTKVKPSKTGSAQIEGTMKFYYLGHPTSMAVEDGTDGSTYIWVPNFASKVINEKSSSYKEYWNAKAIARFKYKDGATLYPWDSSIEYFYFGHPEGDINVAIDFEEGTICVTYHIYTYLGQTRRVLTYSLAEAMALPLEPKDLEISYGSDGAPHSKQVTETKSVMVHDCTRLTPIHHFGIPTDKRDGINTYDWQGFEYHAGLLYFVEGTSYLSMGGSRCALTVFNMDGTYYEPRAYVRVIQDPEELAAFGITTTGAIESEGVKIFKGEMYLGFASNGYMGLGETRANVFKYKMPSNE